MLDLLLLCDYNDVDTEEINNYYDYLFNSRESYTLICKIIKNEITKLF
jgi:hypothetical protein